MERRASCWRGGLGAGEDDGLGGGGDVVEPMGDLGEGDGGVVGEGEWRRGGSGVGSGRRGVVDEERVAGVGVACDGLEGVADAVGVEAGVDGEAVAVDAAEDAAAGLLDGVGDGERVGARAVGSLRTAEQGEDVEGGETRRLGCLESDEDVFRWGEEERRRRSFHWGGG